VAQQGSGPPRFPPGPAPGAGSPGRSDADPADAGEELPPWAIPAQDRPPKRRRSSPRPPGEGSHHGSPDAGPASHDGRAGGDGRAGRDGRSRGDGSRQAGTGSTARDDGGARHGGGHGDEQRLPTTRARATRARRARRRLRVWGALAGGAAVIAVIVYVLLPGGSGSSPAKANGFVTTYLPGEYRSVPDTCDSVSAATLTQYLPGKPTRAALPGLSGNSGNQCDWTLDRKPVYRLLQVTAQAYAPSGLASGNGSATAAATDAYAQDLQGAARPPRKTHLPPARIATIRGLGTTAFSAFQVITAGGDTTDRVTVVARLRNALVIAEFSGLDHAVPGGYGPVSPGQLGAGAVAAARDVLAKIG
jgi:hypothetical protein